MISENLRYHAAGHLAAAAVLCQTHPEAAKLILDVVGQYVNHEKVQAPPQLKSLLAGCADNPADSVAEITRLEAWFVDPFNTIIEKSGGKP